MCAKQEDLKSLKNTPCGSSSVGWLMGAIIWKDTDTLYSSQDLLGSLIVRKFILIHNMPCTRPPPPQPPSMTKCLCSREGCYRNWKYTSLMLGEIILLVILCHLWRKLCPYFRLKVMLKPRIHLRLAYLLMWVCRWFRLLNLPKGKSLGRSKPATNS